MNINAKVKKIGFIGFNRGIIILFYGTLSNNKSFELEIPYTEDGIIVEGKCSTIKRDLGEYFTPQDFIDMGKIYEEVQKLKSDKVVNLIKKVKDIQRKYSDLICSLNSESDDLWGKMNECDNTIKEYQKKLNRLKKEDKRKELECLINNVLKDKELYSYRWNENQSSIDSLATLEIEEISNLEVI